MASLFRCSKDRKLRDSVYSVVSSSEITPGSLDIWIDLPEQIRCDPALAPFKRCYEQRRGKIENTLIENNKSVINKDSNDSTKEDRLTSSDEDESPKEDYKDDDSPSAGNRVTELVAENKGKNKLIKKSHVALVLRILKVSSLVAIWIFFTLALLFNEENEEVSMYTSVTHGEIKEYNLSSIYNKKQLVEVTLTGPIAEGLKSNNSNFLYVWLYGGVETENGKVEKNSTIWSVPLQNEEDMDFAISVSKDKVLSLDLSESITSKVLTDAHMALRISTVCEKSVPLTVSCHLDPVVDPEGLLYSILLLSFLYSLIVFEIVNRTIAALLSSTLAVAVLAICGVRPTLPELVSWLDVETLMLLLSMMLLVSMLAETGLFDYLAVLAFELTSGKTWPLITALCLFTASASTVLDNVTTVLLVTPVTIRLCEVMNLNPIPVLMSMVMFSNVGGAATPVGDPPNVILANHPAVVAENINFTTFTMHMGLGALLVSIQTYFQIRYMLRHPDSLHYEQPSAILDIKHEIAAWSRTAASMTAFSKDEDVVKKALEKKVKKLKTTLHKQESTFDLRKMKTESKFSSTLADLKEKHRIRDKELLIKCLFSVTFVVLVFFLHALPTFQNLSLAWTALLGALLLLVLAECEDVEPILARVEWSTLLFFSALFVFMEALSKLGLIAWIGSGCQTIIMTVGEGSRLAVAIMLILWVSGIASAFVDNIPLTTMMVRVTADIASSELGLPLAPLTWALSFGACLGGNGTLIGASANVVCAGVAEQHGHKITFVQFFKMGFPLMLGHLVVSSIYLILCHCVFAWH